MAMTRAQGGSAIVVDESGGLLGIFTDGDFRRIVTGGAHDGQAVLGLPVADVMTASPQFVYEDAYAAELLKVFEKRRIDDLPVCDRNGRVVGLVDIQDLPRVKVI